MHDLPEVTELVISTLLSNSGLLKLKKQSGLTIGPPVRTTVAFRAEPEQMLTHVNAQKKGSKGQGDALHIFHTPLHFSNI